MKIDSGEWGKGTTSLATLNLPSDIGRFRPRPYCWFPYTDFRLRGAGSLYLLSIAPFNVGFFFFLSTLRPCVPSLLEPNIEDAVGKRVPQH